MGNLIEKAELLGLFRAKFVFEVVEKLVKSFYGFGAWRLFAFHCRDDDVVAESEFFNIAFGVGFETLGEEVVENFFLNGLGVGFFVVDPAGELVSILGRIGTEFGDGFGCLFDGDPIGVHGLNDVVVIIDSTRNLTVSA